MKKYFLVILLTPIYLFATTKPLWKVVYKKKPIDWIMINDTATLKLNAHKGSISLILPENQQNNRAIHQLILMDYSRKEIARVQLDGQSITFKLTDLSTYCIQSQNKSILIYSVSHSTNKAMSIKERVGTQFIGKFQF